MGDGRHGYAKSEVRRKSAKGDRTLEDREQRAGIYAFLRALLVLSRSRLRNGGELGLRRYRVVMARLSSLVALRTPSSITKFYTAGYIPRTQC